MSMKSLTLALALIFFAALSRLLPHPPNFGPITAMALFGAALLERKWLAVIFPFAALYLSDVLLNNIVYGQYYEGLYFGFNPWVYVGFALTQGLGFYLLRGRRVSALAVGGTTLVATLLFFLVTNFGSWLSLPMYPKTTMGLLAAYAAGVPFMINSLLGNLLFAGVLFGGYSYLASSDKTRIADAVTQKKSTY